MTKREIINCRDIDDLSRKAAIVKAMLAPGESESPAASIQPNRGQLSWFVTEDAVADGVIQ